MPKTAAKIATRIAPFRLHASSCARRDRPVASVAKKTPNRSILLGAWIKRPCSPGLIFQRVCTAVLAALLGQSTLALEKCPPNPTDLVLASVRRRPEGLHWALGFWQWTIMYRRVEPPLLYRHVLRRP